MCYLGPTLQHEKDKKLLESVQYFAIQIATKTWSSHNTSLPHELHVPSLESWRQYPKLLYAFKFLNDLSFCPPGFFTINLRIYHSKCLLQPLAKIVFFPNFFIVGSTKLWNSLPNEIA